MPGLRSTARSRYWRAGDRLGSAARRPRALRARALRRAAARPRRSATPPITRRCTRAAPTRPRGGLARRLLAPLRGLAERDRMRFVRGLAPGARVLEVGAGDGKLVALMRAAGLDARGIDPSPAACAAARAQRGRGDLRRRRRRGARAGRARTRSSSGTRSSISTTRPRRWSGSAAGCDPAGRWWSRCPTWARSRPGSAAIDGFIRTFPATARTSPRPAPPALLERTGYRARAGAPPAGRAEPARHVADAAQPAHRANATSPSGCSSATSARPGPAAAAATWR